MTDGTTGIQVAPITEDDMSKVTSILKRAADAIVGMSTSAASCEPQWQASNRIATVCAIRTTPWMRH